MLLQVAKSVFLGNVDVSAVQAFLAENHLEKCRFAAAVTAYQSHALVVAHKQACSVQENLDSEGLGDILYLNHGSKDRKNTLLSLFLWMGIDRFCETGCIFTDWT